MSEVPDRRAALSAADSLQRHQAADTAVSALEGCGNDLQWTSWGEIFTFLVWFWLKKDGLIWVGFCLVLHLLSLAVDKVNLLVVSGKQKEQMREQIRSNVHRGKEKILMVLAAICAFCYSWYICSIIKDFLRQHNSKASWSSYPFACWEGMQSLKWQTLSFLERKCFIGFTFTHPTRYFRKVILTLALE